ncbi:hypothetical protein F5Y09DRAFT_330571 [Xylaria sp. FL1042]|nr:hypothetical protein F5Y09DRAFT_330571 [Xylaria sp. FL1042]
MAHSIQTPSLSSSPADLRPAPLRIPLRKSVASFDDDPGITVTKDKGNARDTSTLTLYPGDPSRHYQSDIPGAPLGGRDLRSKLESLVSRFEILDAVNSVDTHVPQYPSSSYKTRTSTIPRATGSKRTLHHQDLVSYSPIGSMTPASAELSPRQTRPPSACGPRSPFATSTIPVLRHSKTRSPKSKPSRKTNSSFLQSSSTSTTSLPAPKRQETLRRLRKGPKSPAGSSIILPLQRPSFSQPAEQSGETTKPSLNSKSSHYSLRKGQDMPPANSIPRPEKLKETLSVVQMGDTCSHLPLLGKELPSPQSPLVGSVTHESSPSLLRSVRSSLNGTRQKETNMLHEAMKPEPLSQPENEKTTRESDINMGLDALMNDMGSVPFGEQQGDGALAEIPKFQHEQLNAEDTPVRGQKEILEIPIILSQGSRPTQSGGKVSQLRKFFERSSKILSSPLSLMNSHSVILEPDEASSALMGDYSSSSWSESESLRSTHTLARRISIVPSLTTEISVNDFFCDFVGSPSYEASPIATSPSETAAKVISQAKHESPVRNRIQQFEHLSRDSLKVGADLQRHGKYKDPDLKSVFAKGSGKRGMVGSWKPIHEKGVAIWRKISNSLSHSLDSWKDCNSYHEQIDPIEGLSSNTSTDQPASLANDLKRGLGGFSPFGYSMHRVAHTSGHFVTPSYTTPSIQLDDKDTPNNVPRRELDASHSRSAPDTPPPLVIRKGLPVIARVSRGFHRSSGFGLDGHFPSKLVQEEEFRPSEGTTSGPSTPQGDPDALLKVMLKQSAAERSRRREDEKHLRRDKKLRPLSIFKGKSKADGAHYSVASPCPSEEVNKKHEKGKWKGKEILRREPKETEGQSSKGQDNVPNKKTESGFVIFESKDVKLRHPKPRRPGQVRKVANMYKEKGSSGVSVNTKASSGATLKEGRQSFRQKASSALGLRGRKGDGTAS